MAELDVQPKAKRSPLWWLLGVIALLVLILLLMRGCNNNDTAATPADTSNLTGVTTPTGTASPGNSNWDSIDMNAPAASYAEITDTNIHVRGSNGYAIYSLGENVLFDVGKSDIRKAAEPNLKQLSASIAQRFKGGEVRVYGHTDTTGSAASNMQLATARAEAVKNWLVKNSGIDSGRISLHPLGESQPVTSNATAAGRQQNRSVEIVAKQ